MSDSIYRLVLDSERGLFTGHGVLLAKPIDKNHPARIHVKNQLMEYFRSATDEATFEDAIAVLNQDKAKQDYKLRWAFTWKPFWYGGQRFRFFYRVGFVDDSQWSDDQKTAADMLGKKTIPLLVRLVNFIRRKRI